jgi:NAD-dependent dihydropyrimidine dehydrogenase PreA subunit
MPNEPDRVIAPSRERASGRERYVAVNYDRCTCCGACVPVCPPDSVTLVNATLLIDHDTCTRCERCVVVCPTGALTWDYTDEDQA